MNARDVMMKIEDISCDVTEVATASYGLRKLAEDGSPVHAVAALLYHRLEEIAEDIGELHRQLEDDDAAAAAPADEVSQ